MTGTVPAQGRPRDWDADAYHRVSGPQEAWANEVLARTELNGDEALLDAGCGTGRVTERLIERLPNGSVIAVDGSESMVRVARERLGERADVRLGDLSELVLERPVDVIFSNAVFHWILDHDRLFRVLSEALVPGGRLIAQCGGAGNIEASHESIRAVAARPAFAPHLDDMPRSWNFASAEDTEACLADAGFVGARCWLEPKPVTPAEPREFVRTVILGPHLELLPAELHDSFTDSVLTELGSPVVLDYVRLNMEATR